MILPISQRIDNTKAGDCRLIIFSHLLSYYGVEINIGDIIVSASGLDFDFLNYQVGNMPCFFVYGIGTNIEADFSNKVGIDWNKKKYTIDDEQQTEIIKETCLNDIIDLLEQGTPVYVTLDRYYLKYLRIHSVHMPFHAILIIGYDKERMEIYALDSLSDVIVTLSFDTIFQAMFETSVLKNERYGEICYIEKNEHLKNQEWLNSEVIKKQNELYSAEDGPSDRMMIMADFIDSLFLRCKKNNDKVIMNYLKYVIPMLFTEIHDQDFEHYFYRKLYFDSFRKWFEANCDDMSVISKVDQLIEDDIKLWYDLINTREFGQKFDETHVTVLTDGLRAISGKEKEIFSYLNTIL